jgi:hypothetical protein
MSSLRVIEVFPGSEHHPVGISGRSFRREAGFCAGGALFRLEFSTLLFEIFEAPNGVVFLPVPPTRTLFVADELLRSLGVAHLEGVSGGAGDVAWLAGSMALRLGVLRVLQELATLELESALSRTWRLLTASRDPGRGGADESFPDRSRRSCTTNP